MRQLITRLFDTSVLAATAAQADLPKTAARTVGIDVVEPSGIKLRARADDDAQGVIEVQGRLQPARRNAVIALDYMGHNNAPATLLVRTDDEGEFEARLPAAPRSSVRALWAGDDTHAPAFAEPVAAVRGE